MKYEIRYHSDAVQLDVLALPTTLLGQYLKYTDRMESFGPNLGMPHTKAMGDGLFELRLKGVEGYGRVFYCTQVGRRIVMLHSFVKKTDKTPAGELKIARNRLKEI
jgi:phage-related protein